MVNAIIDRVVLIAMAVLLTWIVLEDRKDFRDAMGVAKEYIISLQETNDSLKVEIEAWQKKYWKDHTDQPPIKKGGKVG